MAAKYQLNIMVKSEEVRQYYTDYTCKHEGDSGIDLINYTDIIICNDTVGTINFGIACEMYSVETGELVSYYLYPRSSISNTPLMMANSVGVIDAGYRGNIMAKVRSFAKDDYIIQQNTRLFQICAPDLGNIKINITSELTTSARGTGGFGSTGK